MADINAMIAQGVQPVRLESPINMMAQMSQLQAAQEANQLRQLQVQQLMRQQAQENALRQRVATGAPLTSQEAIVGGAPAMAAFEFQRGQAEKDRIERERKQGAIAEGLLMVRDNPTLENFSQAFRFMKERGYDMGPTAAEIMTMTDEQRKNAVNQFISTTPGMAQRLAELEKIGAETARARAATGASLTQQQKTAMEMAGTLPMSRYELAKLGQPDIEIVKTDQGLFMLNKRTGQFAPMVPPGAAPSGAAPAVPPTVPPGAAPAMPSAPSAGAAPSVTPTFVPGQLRPVETRPLVNVTIDQEKALNKELGEGKAKIVLDSFKAAQDATSIMDTISVGQDLLNKGMITGFGANFLVNAGQALKQAGIDLASDASSNAQVYAANMANNVGRIIKQFGAGTGLSNADREYAEKMAGGNITLDEKALRRILDINSRLATNVISKHNENVTRFKAGDEFKLTQPQPQSSILSPLDQQALNWARQNKDDPRSAQILKRLGVQ